jgi:DNA-binding response OmpR family regulator
MADPRSILIVEDDRNLAETLVYNLKQEGFDAGVARTGLEGIALARTQKPDLLLLDIMLPEVDGFEVCRTVRASSTMPIIMLTAKDDEVDRVLGLELGADDYVVKPFSLRELIARIRAALRRADLNGSGAAAQECFTAGQPATPRLEGGVSSCGQLEVWPGSRSVARNGQKIHLLPREFDLLLYLIQNRGIVLSRRQLLEKVWGLDYFGDERTVDVHVRRLRMKIEPEPSDPQFVHTVYGVGYTFDVRPRKSNDA